MTTRTLLLIIVIIAVSIAVGAMSDKYALLSWIIMVCILVVALSTAVMDD
jgi:hypothetical protein